MAHPKYDPLAELKTLPQFPHIEPRRIARWVDRVEQIDPGRMPWHVRRLSGIGGSEIGVLVGALRGYFHPHSSATKMARQKLLLDLPEEPNGHMLRGQELEPMARDIYRKQILEIFPQAKPRDDIIETLGKFRDEKRPWVIGTPDEVMEVEPGKIWIIDYKCPTKASLAEYSTSGVPFYYAAQLHHYRYIAQKMGFKIDGLQLASLDYDNWRMDLKPVPFDPVLEADCLFAGDYYWNEHVLKGIVPPLGTAKKFGNASELPDNLVSIAADYALERSIANHFDRRADNIVQNIRDADLRLDPNVDSINVGIVDVKAKRSLDFDKMAQELQKHGIAQADLMQPGEWDTDKVLKALAQARGADPENLASDSIFATLKTAPTLSEKTVLEKFRALGFDLSPFIISEELSFGLSRGKNAYAEHMSATIKETLKDSAASISETLRESMINAEFEFNAADIERTAKRSRKP